MQEEQLLFGFDPTTVIFTGIFLILVLGLFVASCAKSCKNPLHDEKPNSFRSKAYLAQEIPQDSISKYDTKQPDEQVI